MTNREIFTGIPETWPTWLDEEKIDLILNAAREGEEAERDLCIIAGMVYLGLSAVEASEMPVYRALGDAISDPKTRNTLIVPDEYHAIATKVLHTQVDRGVIFNYGNRLVECTKAQAKAVAEQVFRRAGLKTENCEKRLRRTAARLHYKNDWTDEHNIRKWFHSEIRYIEEENEELYYKTDRYEGEIELLYMDELVPLQARERFENESEPE